MIAGVLHASIRMCDQALSRKFSFDGHFQRVRVRHESTVDSFRHRPAYDLPGIEILNRCQIQPPLGSGNVSDVGHPCEILSGRREIAIDDVIRNRQLVT